DHLGKISVALRTGIRVGFTFAPKPPHSAASNSDASPNNCQRSTTAPPCTAGACSPCQFAGGAHDFFLECSEKPSHAVPGPVLRDSSNGTEDRRDPGPPKGITKGTWGRVRARYAHRPNE